VLQDQWFTRTTGRIREAFANGARLVRVTAPLGVDTPTFCRLVKDDCDSKTLVVTIDEPVDDPFALLAQLARALGLVHNPPASDRHADHLQLRQTLHTFLRSLRPIGARCLVLVDSAANPPADAFQELAELADAAAVGGWPLYAVVLRQAPADPFETPRGAVSPLPFARRRQIATALIIVAAVAGTALTIGSGRKPPDVAARAEPPRPQPQQNLLGTIAQPDGEQPRASAGTIRWRDGQSAEAVMRDAAARARRGDVKALLALRASIGDAQLSESRTAGLIKRLDALIDEARRRQLAIDHQQLTTDEPRPPARSAR
jgi:hypothetical protein